MAIIEIEAIEDEPYECEVCGTSYASGFSVTIDGKPFGDFEPVADCIGERSYEIEDVMKALLEHFGHKVDITW